MRMVREAALLVVILVLFISRVAAGDELAEFEKGRNSYGAGRYEEAAQRFAEMLDPTREGALESAQLIEQARIYRSASLIALGRFAEADEQIELMLRGNANVYPDPILFPGQVLDRFADVRGRIRQELEDMARAEAEKERRRIEQEREDAQREQDRVRKLEKAAQREVHVVYNSRWIAAIPFGVGQFQNDQQSAAWTLLISETALATTTVVTGAIVQELQSKGMGKNVDTADVNRRVSAMKTVNNVSFAALGVVVLAGVVHAQWTFVPKREVVRSRPLPAELRATPTVTTVRDGAMVGLRGVF